MRAAITIVLGCLALSFSGYSLASCGGGGCASDINTTSTCSSGDCNPHETQCQCTDSMCHHPEYSDCISRAYCCEAFGNIGGR